MPVRDLLILIPCHGLEDFPTDLGEDDAAGLLNAFTVGYHPAILAAIGSLPTWRRADDPPAASPETAVIVPSAASSWLPCDWRATAEQAGMIVVEGVSDRAELIAALSERLSASRGRRPAGSSGPESSVESREQNPGAGAPGSPSTLDLDLAPDFLALGTALLQLELLTRRMHYYSNIDGAPLRPELLAAATAAVEGREDEARRGLSRCFEILLDARERFFPVGCHLIDLCLLVPRLADKLPDALSPTAPTNLLATAADWERIAVDHPDLAERIRADWEANRVCLVGGEYREGPTSVMPAASQVWELERGLAVFRTLFGRTPRVWARRRYGFSTLLPQLLDRAGMPFALHVALDDGIYPDEEQSKVRWEGCDGTGVDAFSRIPLAADGATSFLRFATRLAESMEQDRTAAIMLARWPELTTPWFDDLRRTHQYAPVFGKFVTLEAFFEETDPPGRTLRHAAKEYLPPYLTQSVARRRDDPIGRFAAAVSDRRRFETAAWLRTFADLLGLPKPETSSPERARAAGLEGNAIRALEDRVEQSGPDAETPDAQLSPELAAVTDAAARDLAAALLHGAPKGRGLLIFNPLSFARLAAVTLPADFLPAVEGPVKHVQSGNAGNEAILDLPAAGFLYLSSDIPPSKPTARRRAEPALAEGTLLRNEFFEVHVGEATGGIAYVKGYGRSPKRISQQLAYRFPRQRKVGGDEWGEDKTYYSAMRATRIEVVTAGPTIGEIATAGELFDQTNGDILATFRQNIRVTRGRPVIDLTVSIEPTKLPDGDPWTNHYCCRWAWADAASVVTRSVQGTAQAASEGRFDAADYVEIAEGETRTTLVPLSTPFHRLTGPRMLDSLLLVAGETTREFRFAVVCDEPFPLRAALAAQTPPVVLPVESGPPRSGPAGWFLNVDAKNVQATGVRPLPPTEDEPQPGLVVRLTETEGRAKTARLTCFRTPTAARLVDLTGRTLTTLKIEADAVAIDLNRYEIATVELRF